MFCRAPERAGARGSWPKATRRALLVGQERQHQCMRHQRGEGEGKVFRWFGGAVFRGTGETGGWGVWAVASGVDSCDVGRAPRL